MGEVKQLFFSSCTRIPFRTVCQILDRTMSRRRQLWTTSSSSSEGPNVTR